MRQVRLLELQRALRLLQAAARLDGAFLRGAERRFGLRQQRVFLLEPAFRLRCVFLGGP